MGTKRTVVVIHHDEGYGDQLLKHLNVALLGKDMEAEAIYETQKTERDAANNIIEKQMGFGPDHLKIKADLWLFTEQRGDNREARCCVCNKAKLGIFTSINVVVLGCKNFLAGKMCGECFPRMKALWERNGMIINETKAVDVASTAQGESSE